MRGLFAKTFTLTLLLAVASAASFAEIADPIGVLKSDASYAEKEAACRQLSLTGNADAIPVLAAMLTDDKLNHMARYALEPMPFPEAGQALRDALGKTTGSNKVGVISSLAVRKDEQAVPELIKILPEGDSEVARAAANALGTIATAEAQQALQQAVAEPNLPQGKFNALCEGLFRCAETLAHNNKREDAAKVYDQLKQLPDAPRQVRLAAIRGSIQSRDLEQGLTVLLDTLRADDENSFIAGLRTAREMSGSKGLAAALASLLPSLPPARQIRVLELFGDKDGNAAGEGALALAGAGEPDVRTAAIRAVTRMHYSPALKLIADLSWGDDDAIATVARESLAHFPGMGGAETIESMLHADQTKERIVAIKLVSDGGLEKPAATLIKAAESDSDASVRVAALEGLHEYAGLDELPRLLAILSKAQSDDESRAAEGTLSALCARQQQMPSAIAIQNAVYGDLPSGASANVTDQVKRLVDAGSRSVDASNANFGEPAPNIVKKLRVDYTENGVDVSKTVSEGETLKLGTTTTPQAIVDAFTGAYNSAQGNAKLAALRLLGVTGSPKALDLVKNATTDAALKDAALRTLCNWPTADALPTVMDLAKSAPDDATKDAAFRGAVRMLGLGALDADATVANFTTLMGLVGTPDEKKVVLSGLTQLPSPSTFALALAQLGDAAVKAEAVQAAAAIAGSFGKGASEEKSAFNGTDLSGWQGDTKYWRVEDGAIVGQNSEALAQPQSLRSSTDASDFYLAMDVKFEPGSGSGNLLFRAANDNGYLAGLGQTKWGELLRTAANAKIDGNENAAKAAKPDDWNHVEILAVGPAIWTVINGQLVAACVDSNASNNRSGGLALQLNAGPPQLVRYRIQKCVHNPKIATDGQNTKDLIGALHPAQK